MTVKIRGDMIPGYYTNHIAIIQNRGSTVQFLSNIPQHVD